MSIAALVASAAFSALSGPAVGAGVGAFEVVGAPDGAWDGAVATTSKAIGPMACVKTNY